MRIFIVEDDPFFANLIEFVLEQNPDNEVRKFETGQAVLDQLHLHPDVISLDYSLPDMNGRDLLAKVKARSPESRVVIISSQQDVGTAIAMLKEGAYDYIVKDDDIKDRIWNTFRHLKGENKLKKEVEVLREKVQEKYDFSQSIIGESEAIKKSFRKISKAAKTSINVTISGETGTGKEVVANAIHFNSARKKEKFVAVNMAAIPRELIESELFGHEKGAFTGAMNTRIGRFEEAHGGSIFLDEIGELDLNVQAKLLRVLQERKVIRVGGNKAIEVDVRIISATHKNLAEEVKNGSFRQDLYYRLLGLPVELPPLRDRGKDILLLAKVFLESFSKGNQTPILLSREAKNKLMSYHYPGNVRELKSVVELAAVMAEGEQIEVEDITFNQLDGMGDLLMEADTLRGYTRKIIQHYLDKYEYNVMKVADKLEIGKSKIYQMIKDEELSIK
ncbi:MAG: sigma-54 dependent transcriptional regulator [Bacteroidia bacterium]|nr:sigma-54 dependent transcriptional regulator [Bacteroidia bacterium]